MRISTSNSASTMALSSSTSKTQHHPQLLFHSTISDGYDFNRAQSSESTENAMAGKGEQPSSSAPVVSPVVPSSSCATVEDRDFLSSPKKLPPTPTRDHGSPYRPSASTEENHLRFGFGSTMDAFLLPPSSATMIGQPFLAPRSTLQYSNSNSNSTGSLSQQPFLRTSSWGHIEEEENHGSSIFRSPPVFLSDEDSVKMSREHESRYTIQRCDASDECDDNDRDCDHDELSSFALFHE